MKRIISTFLVFTMVFCSLPMASFAATGNSYSVIENNYQVTDSKELFNSMTPEAQAILEHFILENKYSNPELYNYHVSNVKPVIERQSLNLFMMNDSQPRMATMSIAAPLEVLASELQVLNLPSAVYYAFMSVGASLVAAAGDGALPFGDIVAIVATIVTGGVVGYYWDEVGPKWSKITIAFSRAFDSILDNIDDVFDDIKADLIYKSIPTKLRKGQPDGYIDMGKFTQKVHGDKVVYKDPKTKWTIDKDKGNHGGRKWKLRDRDGNRVASVDENGKVLAD